METVLLVLHLMVAIFLVAVILLQQSSAGALDGLGGGNSASSFLSARGKGNLLTRVTAILAGTFILTSILLSIYYKNPEHKAKSILDVAPVVEESAAPSVPVVPTDGE
ncbi:MAG: preprotein translocase subunit SecG [Alphaproteobacteria bacterium]|nr:preprotein translocase subunit SecG [Alphaproteobacteria bacterium]